jgi:hypothetical protein
MTLSKIPAQTKTDTVLD